MSGLLVCLVLWAYSRYARRPSLGRYLLVAIAFTLGLLSKAMLVTFPCLLLLLDFWPLRRSASGAKLSRLILEKLPFVLLAAALSVATVLAQEPALKGVTVLPLLWRVENAAVTAWVILR